MLSITTGNKGMRIVSSKAWMFKAYMMLTMYDKKITLKEYLQKEENQGCLNIMSKS